MEKIKELRAACIAAGVDENKLKIDEKMKGLHINAADHQLIIFDGENYCFNAVGGSRYSYIEKFNNAAEAAEFIFKNISEKTTQEINEEYKAIWGAINNL